ncbi:hypothetical protein DFH09DRAFT_1339729 [Mycena vulgaris]|nr:hypothetical protein DFH09DRAFT_1339729 [Mycena vulgaris]
MFRALCPLAGELPRTTVHLQSRLPSGPQTPSPLASTRRSAEHADTDAFSYATSAAPGPDIIGRDIHRHSPTRREEEGALLRRGTRHAQDKPAWRLQNDALHTTKSTGSYTTEPNPASAVCTFRKRYQRDSAPLPQLSPALRYTAQSVAARGCFVAVRRNGSTPRCKKHGHPLQPRFVNPQRPREDLWKIAHASYGTDTCSERTRTKGVPASPSVPQIASDSDSSRARRERWLCKRDTARDRLRRSAQTATPQSRG